jgi:hypothetical protein
MEREYERDRKYECCYNADSGRGQPLAQTRAIGKGERQEQYDQHCCLRLDQQRIGQAHPCRWDRPRECSDRPIVAL